MRTKQEILDSLPPEIVANYHRTKAERRLFSDLLFNTPEPGELLVGILADTEQDQH